MKEHLFQILSNYKKIAVAFSGGIDSSFLLIKAKEVLGKENVLAIIFDSELIKKQDTDHAINFAKKHDIWYEVLKMDELEHASIRYYTKDSWYYSKKLMYLEMIRLANSYDINYVADGMIMDDINDIRPGMRARNELAVLSPLQEAGYYKVNIREQAKSIEGLRWNQPSSCSVFSRFPYNSEITHEKVRQIMSGETFLEKLGFEQVRVRHHESLVRIEVPEEQLKFAIEERYQIDSHFKSLGFTYVSLDLLGFESGKMNSELTKGEKL
ncbi:ATP-dependent sacrificial sulfur transferase LarE [Streptococcus moroccensis]|uniref:NAD/GMP synthase domain-containing protein n=1 Tax=Streptococcus moroccensis TaxID=1451356 RepID=A0ABT9YSM5_9STRE|nr:ATP-dependent sacrificial sulfur transferase LarE [Streptococcus moroccensis]MDQ0222606.1 uncharacterized protein [Streptococcus moroccensis]